MGGVIDWEFCVESVAGCFFVLRIGLDLCLYVFFTCLMWFVWFCFLLFDLRYLLCGYECAGGEVAYWFMGEHELMNYGSFTYISKMRFPYY